VIKQLIKQLINYLLFSRQAPDRHVNLFEDLEAGETTHADNKEREAEKKAEQEDYEKKIGLLTYLGQDTHELTGERAWWQKKREDLQVLKPINRLPSQLLVLGLELAGEREGEEGLAVEGLAGPLGRRQALLGHQWRQELHPAGQEGGEEAREVAEEEEEGQEEEEEEEEEAIFFIVFIFGRGGREAAEVGPHAHGEAGARAGGEEEDGARLARGGRGREQCQEEGGGGQRGRGQEVQLAVQPANCQAEQAGRWQEVLAGMNAAVAFVNDEVINI